MLLRLRLRKKNKQVADEQERIEAGRRVAEFLDDPVIQAAIERVRQEYLALFVEAESDHELVVIQSAVRALHDIEQELRRVRASGERAEIERQRREDYPLRGA